MSPNMIDHPKIKRVLPIGVLICFSVIIYFNSLSNGFVYDDLGTIVENVHIKHLGKYFSSFYNSSYFKISGGEASYRPVATLSYYLLYALFKLNPFGYHLTSIALHTINVILVYLLAFRILGHKRSSLIAGLLFACHPVQTEAVNAISYNEDLLAAFFYFLALALYMQSGAAASRRNLIFFMLSLLFFLLGLLSKEMAITLPVMVVLYDVTLREPPSGKPFLRRVREVIQNRKYYYGGYLGLSLFYLWLRFVALHNPEAVEIKIWGRLFDRIIYLPVLFFNYIKLSIFPLHLNADHVYTYPTRFFDLLPILSLMMVMGLVVFSFVVYRYAKAASFGIWWFFITLFPVYNLIQIFNPFAERYLYIPLFGFCLVIAILVEHFLSRISFARPGAVTVFLISCLVVFYSMISINRNKDWKDSYSLWTKTLEIEPNSIRAHGNLARIYQEKGFMEAALREAKQTIKLNPKGFKAYFGLGAILDAQGFQTEAISAYKKTIELNPNFKDAHFNLGNIYKAQSRLEEAKQAYKKVVALDPEDIEARNNLGVIYAMQGTLDAALSEWQKAIALDPQNKQVQANIEKAERIIRQSK